MTKEQQHHIGLLILRVSLGFIFIAHGYLKVFTFGLRHAMDVFEAHTIWHINMIPGWVALPSATIEWRTLPVSEKDMIGAVTTILTPRVTQSLPDDWRGYYSESRATKWLADVDQEAATLLVLDR